LWQKKWTLSKRNMFLMLYQVLGTADRFKLLLAGGSKTSNYGGFWTTGSNT